MMQTTFSYACWPFGYHLLSNKCSISCLLLKKSVVCLLLIDFWACLDTSPLLENTLLDLFGVYLLICGWPFILNVFWKTKVLNFNKVFLIKSFTCGWYICVLCLKNTCLSQVRKHFKIFFSINLIYDNLDFFFLLYCKVEVFSVFLSYVYPVDPAAFIENTIFSSSHCSVTSIINQITM